MYVNPGGHAKCMDGVSHCLMGLASVAYEQDGWGVGLGGEGGGGSVGRIIMGRVASLPGHCGMQVLAQ